MAAEGDPDELIGTSLGASWGEEKEMLLPFYEYLPKSYIPRILDAGMLSHDGKKEAELEIVRAQVIERTIPNSSGRIDDNYPEVLVEMRDKKTGEIHLFSGEVLADKSFELRSLFNPKVTIAQNGTADDDDFDSWE